VSTNLKCNVFDVRQTSSYITDMILSYNQEGEIDGGMEGAARRYTAWCNYTRQYQLNAAISEHEQRWIDTDWSTHIYEFQRAIQLAVENGEAVVFDSI